MKKTAVSTDLPILSYAAKYASSYDNPCRDDAEPAPQFGDRLLIEWSQRTSINLLKGIKLDTVEGASMLMVKPALGYMDIIWQVKETSNLPVAAHRLLW
ncbi:MAG: hypothetical protein AAGD25_06265 [Cyanobacteria bacterium P01_F01_bin.150]